MITQSLIFFQTESYSLNVTFIYSRAVAVLHTFPSLRVQTWSSWRCSPRDWSGCCWSEVAAGRSSPFTRSIMQEHTLRRAFLHSGEAVQGCTDTVQMGSRQKVPLQLQASTAQLRILLIQRCPLVIRSMKTHFNTRCKRGPWMRSILIDRPKTQIYPIRLEESGISCLIAEICNSKGQCLNH